MNVAANPDSMGRNCTRPARARHVPKVIRCARTSNSDVVTTAEFHTSPSNKLLVFSSYGALRAAEVCRRMAANILSARPIMSVSMRDDLQQTYGDYLVWSRTHGDEVIDGTAYVREPPSPAYSHQAFAFEIARQLENQLDGTPWRVIIAPMDVRIPKASAPDDQIDTVVQPDIIITRDKSKIDTRGVRGAPDWLAEVQSPSAANYDRTVKIPMYGRAGEPEVR